MRAIEEPVAEPLPGVVDAALPTRSVAARIRGIDMARALAIVGMVMVHFGPFPIPVDDAVSFAYSTSYGKASILFALLAGVGIALLAGDRSPERLRATWLRIALRVVVLFPAGVALQLLPHRVAVILQYYAVYFVVAGLVMALADRWLLVIAGMLLVTGPLAVAAGIALRPEWFEQGGEASFGEPLVLLRDIVLTGYYPTLTWAPVVLFGMWVGRRDLKATAVRWRLVIGGALAAAAAYLGARGLQALLDVPADVAEGAGLLVSSAGHSEMPLSIIGATGVACAVLGGCLLLAAWLPRLCWPLVAAGQLALSIYVGHIFVLAAVPELLERDDVLAAALSVGRFTVVVALLATLWRVFFERGPFEALMHLPWRLYRGARV